MRSWVFHATWNFFRYKLLFPLVFYHDKIKTMRIQLCHALKYNCCFEIIWNIYTVVFAILLGIPNGACVWRWNHALLLKQNRHEIVINLSFSLEWTHMHSNRTIRLCSRYVWKASWFSSAPGIHFFLSAGSYSEPDESDFAYDFITYDPVKTRL